MSLSYKARLTDHLCKRKMIWRSESHLKRQTIKKIQQSGEAAISLLWHRQNKLLKLLNFAILTSKFCYLGPDAELLNTLLLVMHTS